MLLFASFQAAELRLCLTTRSRSTSALMAPSPTPMSTSSTMTEGRISVVAGQVASSVSLTTVGLIMSTSRSMATSLRDLTTAHPLTSVAQSMAIPHQFLITDKDRTLTTRCSPNNALKPKSHRYATNMVENVCHVASYALQFGLTRALGCS